MTRPISNESLVVGILRTGTFSETATTLDVQFNRQYKTGKLQEEGIEIDDETERFVIDGDNDQFEIVLIPSSTRTYDRGTGITTCEGAAIKRGLAYSGYDTSTEVADNKKSHTSGATVEVRTDHYPQAINHNIMRGEIDTGGTTFKLGDGAASDKSLEFSTDATTNPKIVWDDSLSRFKLSWGDDAPAAGDLEVGLPQLTTTERDARTWGDNGIIIYNVTDGEYQQRVTGSWVTLATGGTFPNASETVAGKNEKGTRQEILDGIDIGGTGAYNFAVPSDISSIINVDVSDTTVSNSDSEETLYQVSIPADTLAVGRFLKIRLYVESNATGSGTFVLRFKYGSTTVAQTDTIGSITAQYFECLLFLSSVGNQKGYFWAFFGGQNDDYKFGTATEDETTTLNIAVTIQYSAADAGNNITVGTKSCELIF